jgi:hypothetical protein
MPEDRTMYLSYITEKSNYQRTEVRFVTFTVVFLKIHVLWMWYCGTVALWYCGTVVLWHWYCGTVVLWHCDTMHLTR